MLQNSAREDSPFKNQEMPLLRTGGSGWGLGEVFVAGEFELLPTSFPSDSMIREHAELFSLSYKSRELTLLVRPALPPNAENLLQIT